MCGIMAGVAQRDIGPILLEGLKRLEYRGYDSAGLATINANETLQSLRICGKVNELVTTYEKNPLLGKMGIAHTRWATHGEPSRENAHPHCYEDKVALVHNGIIENYLKLQTNLLQQGASFSSQTDSEVIVQWIGKSFEKTGNLLAAVQETVKKLEGAYALALVSPMHPDRIIAVRYGSPLVIGLGINENFVASDSLALLPVAQNFIVLEEGDIAEIFRDKYVIYDREGKPVERAVRKITLSEQSADRGQYRHYMLKEIFEQPEAVRAVTSGRLGQSEISDFIFGAKASDCFDRTRSVQIVACGTSFHAGLVAKYWLEQIVGISCEVEVASEFRYRKHPLREGTLFVVLSQSGETADTLAALRGIKDKAYCGKLAICNVPESSLVREAELVFLTHAGPEIGVASTKAFTAQLVALLMLVQCLGKRNDSQTTKEMQIVQALQQLPHVIKEVLALDDTLKNLAQRFDNKQHTLFIGRGIYYPIVKEGALKLKEISYIHAEAYPAGELKHGPLALVDKHMPVIALVPDDALLDKLISNLQEIRARQGELIVFTQKSTGLNSAPGMTVVSVPDTPALLMPMAFNTLLQLLAYHVAVLKGTDVDQPRNLAKSVTVE